MKNKAVRLFTVSICCLAIPLVAATAAQDNKKKKKQGQQQQQAQHPGQPGEKHQNVGNQNKGNKGPNNPNNPNMGNKWNKANKGKQGVNNPNKPNKQNIAKQGNKGNKGQQNLNNPDNPNNPNIANKGKNWQNNPNKAKWQTKHFDNVAKGPKANVKSVTFQKNYKIQGAQHWQGAHYAAFRNYNSEWHDHSWWHNHYGRNLVLIGGGWYFLNNGFWAPAWGYNPAQAYYPYNGPIYAYRNLPPDQVIANVQASLQEQGYYTGEVDGLLGPLTQEALVNFQNANDLAPTGSIDEPTLDALGMS